MSSFVFTSLSLILGIKIPLTAVGGLAYKFFHVFFVIFSVLFDNTLFYLFWGIFFEINYIFVCFVYLSIS